MLGERCWDTQHSELGDRVALEQLDRVSESVRTGRSDSGGASAGVGALGSRVLPSICPGVWAKRVSGGCCATIPRVAQCYRLVVPRGKHAAQGKIRAKNKTLDWTCDRGIRARSSVKTEGFASHNPSF